MIEQKNQQQYVFISRIDFLIVSVLYLLMNLKYNQKQKNKK